jgi:hypothetical protein
MKSVTIHRDAETGRLGYCVREGQKIIQEESSAYSDIRKLRRHLRRSIGKSIIIWRSGG